MADQKEGLSNIVPKKRYSQIEQWQLSKSFEQKDKPKPKDSSGILKY